VLSSPTTTRRTAEETLLDALKAPFGVAEVPLRLSTFTQQAGDSDKVRILLAAEVGQPGAEPEEFTVGHALLDAEGNVVASAIQKRILSAPKGSTKTPRDYLGEIVVDPGVYSLRFGVVDSSGRRGGLIRDVSAWKLADEEFALGDLLIGDVGSDARQTLRPGVEPRVQDNLGAVLELYSNSAAVLDTATVSFEIADDQDGPALVTAPAQPTGDINPTQRSLQGVMSAAMLPPGRYVARARVLRGGTVAGVLVRPFILEATDGARTPLPFLRGNVAKFESRFALARDVVGSLLDLVQKQFPSLVGPLDEARAGRYGVAAIEAMTAGEQVPAAFLKGVDWYSKGQLDQAVTQLQLAAGPRREFFPAAFYLGAVYAAAGRDRDAAGVWQMAIGGELRPPFAYTLFADARLRDGQPASVIDVLKPAYARMPDNDEIGQRLTAAYLMTGRYEEALPVLDAYLSRHPTDELALFAAVYAQYEVTAGKSVVLSTADQAKLTRYVRAYKGPHQALLAKYLQTLRGK
jgi:tetratricopeptide (TPR) repeat protein